MTYRFSEYESLGHKRTLLFLVCMFFSSHPVLANEISASVIYDHSQILNSNNDQQSIDRALFVLAYERQITRKTKLHIEAQAFRGDNGAEIVGDLQVFSNIDESDFSRLYEVWIESLFLDDSLRVKVGKIDANTEFAFADSASEFINSSMGFSPTIAFLPTYPTPTLGALASVKTGQANQLVFGAFSDESQEFENVFSIVEYQLNRLSWQVKFGLWSYSGDVTSVDSQTIESSTEGAYATVENDLAWPVFNVQSARWFFQLGLSDGDYSEIEMHYGAGVMLQGFGARTLDSAGIGVTHITTSNLRGSELPSSETSIEFFYRYTLNDYLALKPNIQYIRSPAAIAEGKNTWVATLRAELSW
ncbi:carbohydrate porin [Alteromonas flava]|uniref:carbohydrate porin n=1 Tax=Alteromonas flava TaxID=2048003 RepID=UPI0013DC60F9|nr:carbohydrate porin [Alteromonas flava]